MNLTTPVGLLWEPSERWVRGRKGEVTVVDSRHPVLVWEPEVPVPLYAFPREEVREDLLRPAKNPRTGTHTGSRVFYDLEVDGELLENAAWTFPAEDLVSHIAFEWFCRSGRGLDHWYEEEEEIFIHPRDPHKRVDALPSSRHVVIEIDGTVVADTRCPVLLFETGLPTRYYIPREDVRLGLFVPSGLSTGCPYKGHRRVLVVAGRRQHPREPRVELPGATARGGRRQRPPRLLQRSGRHHRGRGTPGAPRHPVHLDTLGATGDVTAARAATRPC